MFELIITAFENLGPSIILRSIDQNNPLSTHCVLLRLNMVLTCTKFYYMYCVSVLFFVYQFVLFYFSFQMNLCLEKSDNISSDLSINMLLEHTFHRKLKEVIKVGTLNPL